MTINDLATNEEVKEVAAVGQFSAPNHDPKCAKKHTILKYAFQQPGYQDIPATHFWHVISEGRSKHSTLSIDGLKEWGLI